MPSLPQSPIDSPPTSPTGKPSKSPVISSGRGGSGNIRATSKLKLDDNINEAEILQKRRAEAALNPRVKVKYTGRGGSGNIRAASQAQSVPFDASADPDDEYELLVLQGAQAAKRDKTPSTGRGGLGNSARARSKSFGTSSVGLKAKKDKSRRRRSFASLRFTATSFSSTEHYELQRVSTETSSFSVSIPSPLSPTPSSPIFPPSHSSSNSSSRPSSVKTLPTPHVKIRTSSSNPTIALASSPLAPRLSTPNLCGARSPTDLERRIAECRRTLAEPYINTSYNDDDNDPYNDANTSNNGADTLLPIAPAPPPHKLQKVQSRPTVPAPSPAKWWKRGSRRPSKANTTISAPFTAAMPDNNADVKGMRGSVSSGRGGGDPVSDERMEEIMGHLEEVGKHAMEVRSRLRMREQGGYVQGQERQRQPVRVQVRPPPLVQAHHQPPPSVQAHHQPPPLVQAHHQPTSMTGLGRPQQPRYGYGHGYGYGERVQAPMAMIGRETESDYETESDVPGSVVEDEDEEGDVYGVHADMRVHEIPLTGRSGSAWTLHAVEEEEGEFVSFLEF